MTKNISSKAFSSKSFSSKSFSSKSFTPPGGFVFTDSDAENYYNALSTQNGGDIDSSTIYGITLDTFKNVIDDLFVSLKSNSLYSKFVRLYLFLGDNANTNSLNAINSVSELTYVGSPTFGQDGMTLNGLTQYADMNNDSSVDLAQYDWSIGIDGTSINSKLSIGSRDTPTIGCVIRWRASTLLGYSNAISLNGTTPTTFDHQVIVSRFAANSSNMILDGVNYIVNNSPIVGALPSTQSFLIGSWSNSGTPLDLTSGNIRHAFIGSSISEAEALILKGIFDTFNTALGR